MILVSNSNEHSSISRRVETNLTESDFEVRTTTTHVVKSKLFRVGKVTQYFWALY